MGAEEQEGWAQGRENPEASTLEDTELEEGLGKTKPLPVYLRQEEYQQAEYRSSSFHTVKEK